jgi:hypothetical protein
LTQLNFLLFDNSMLKAHSKAFVTLFSLFIFIFICAPAFGYEFSKEEYETIRDTSLEITQKFTNYYYLGVGRSPTPIIAFLQNYLGHEHASNLPLSNFRAISQGKPPSISDDLWGTKGKLYAPVTHDEELRLFRHFDIFFPKDPEIQNKKVLLIDYVTYGGSIIAAKQALRSYLKARGRNCKLEILVLSQRNRRLLIEEIEKWAHSKLNFIEFKSDNKLVQRFFNEHYDSLAEYPTFIVRPNRSGQKIIDSETLIPRSEYTDFSNSLATEMKRQGDFPKKTSPSHAPLNCSLPNLDATGTNRSEKTDSMQPKACSLP